MHGMVYKITNIINGKMYVGQTTKTLKQRWAAHVYDSVGDRKKQHNSYLHSAIEKHGKNNFIIEVLVECPDKKSMDEAEKLHIEKLSTVRPKGYNISLGGTACMHGRRMSAEAKQRISESLKRAYASGKRKPNGPIHDDESKKKISISLLGNKRSVGRVHSPETKEKMRLSHLGKKYKTKKSISNT
jgi:group I intron endonuclease